MIDSQWIQYLGEHAELVKIPPFVLIKLLGGTIEDWMGRFPQSLFELSDRLDELCKRYDIRMMYLNLPAYIPFLLMARSYAGIDLGFLFLAHSVGSEFWVKQWIGIAPWLAGRDVLLASTDSSKEALLRISERYELAARIPLCIAMKSKEQRGTVRADNRPKQLLSIGRIEDVKNIDVLLECFKEISSMIPNSRLIIAGEYTGQSTEQIQLYRNKLERILDVFGLWDRVSFVGPVDGESKDDLYRNSDLLINLSTDPGETFGFNLIEAKVWGLPVVCTNWDGFREVVRHGVDGFLIDCDWEHDQLLLNKQQTIDYCMRLLQEEDLQHQMSQNAQRAAEEYDYKRITPLIVDAVQEALDRKVVAMPNAPGIATVCLSEMPRTYRLDNLRQLPYSKSSLLSILSSENAQPLDAWMSKVKPLIDHYAGQIALTFRG